MELLWDGGSKGGSNSPGHITKMAAMPICPYMVKKQKPKKNFKILRTKWPKSLKLGIQHRALEYYQDLSETTSVYDVKSWRVL